MRYLVLALFLSGCLSDPQIADQVIFRVNFASKLAHVHFVLKPEFESPSLEVISFQPMGKIFWSADADGRPILGAELQDDPNLSELGFPIFERFPNGKKLPSFAQAGPVYQFEQGAQDFAVALLEQRRPRLILGGLIRSDLFSGLSPSSLRTQKFKSFNGDLQATMSLAGPTTEFSGGLYFLADFGENPFRHGEPSLAEEVTWTLYAEKSKGWTSSNLLMHWVNSLRNQWLKWAQPASSI